MHLVDYLQTTLSILDHYVLHFYLFVHQFSTVDLHILHKHKCATNLRLHKPPILPATSIAGLEMIG